MSVRLLNLIANCCKRVLWFPLGGTILVALLLACTQQAPSAPAPKAAEKPGATTPIPTVAAPKIAASPAAASPAPSPAVKAAPSPVARARVEPKGKVVYAFDTGLPPAWLDPQEVPTLATPYVLLHALHDGLVRHLPGQPFAPALAESYEVASDFKSATFKLREGIKFHNGDPVTPEDVKWTFENYKGGNAKALKDKTERIETPDARTIKFTFKEPFLDFLILYGTSASGAGWVVPKKYYEQVGPNGFKQKPIGAGPFKFVRQVAESEYEFEANIDYWRKTPPVKTLIVKGVTESATRIAQLQTGETDIIHSVPPALLDTIQKTPGFQLSPVQSAVFWMEFSGFEKPDSPFNKKEVREAVALALDQKAYSEAETGGLLNVDPVSNWIPLDMPGALKGPDPRHDPTRARQLLADAGYPNGFEVEQLTPFPPFDTVGERAMAQLREVGIKIKRLNTMERGAFAQKQTEGPEALPGLIINISGAPGDAATRVRTHATCKGSNSRTCVPEIEERFTRYERSTDPLERARLLDEIQQFMMDSHIFVPVYRRVAIGGVGPRIANRWEEFSGAIPQFIPVGPYEDIQVKD